MNYAPRIRLITATVWIVIAVVCYTEGLTDDLRLEIAAHIRTTFESSLFTFPPDIQAHYAVRLYRITGDERYIYSIVFNLLVEVDQMHRDADSIFVTNYAKTRTEQLLDEFKNDSRKSRYRRKLFENSATMLFYLECLHRCAKISDDNIPDSDIADDVRKTVAHLRTIDFSSFLLNPDVIRYYGAQAVNFIYDLYYLEIDDLRQEYRETFQQVFPGDEDAMLSSLEFKDKIYGLTHFIFADTRYYQRKVSPEEHAWILDYFSSTIERILEETKEDIIAEVGLCYLLVDRGDAPEVMRCRQAILSAFDSDKGMIPSVSGDDDLQKGEHRNVLAIMLLSDWDDLHPGPDFSTTDHYRSIITDD